VQFFYCEALEETRNVKTDQPMRCVCLALILVATAAMVGCRRGQPAGGRPSTTTGGSGSFGETTGNANLVAIDIVLPAPAFRGTPVPGKEPNVEAPREGPRKPFLAPEGTLNLARGKPVGCSDPAPVSGEVDFVTDGDKEASDFARHRPAAR
jgi:hypothetical protein